MKKNEDFEKLKHQAQTVLRKKNEASTATMTQPEYRSHLAKKLQEIVSRGDATHSDL